MAWDPLGGLSALQKDQLDTFAKELARINERMSLVAASTIPHLEERHIVHSMSLAHRAFPDGASVVDFGAGGGLPSIPLAIRFPGVQFTAVDSVRKKTEAILLFARRIGLKNLAAWNGRAEGWGGTTHYAVSRATAPLLDLWTWFERAYQPLESIPADCWPQGLLALKGGELDDEINDLLSARPALTVRRTNICDLIGEPYFENKEIISISST